MSSLFVASAGGHLAELCRLAKRLPDDGCVRAHETWITFDTPQSRSLLRDRDVHFIPYTGPRDIRRSVRNARFARSLFRREHFDRVISTGAAPAASFLPMTSRGTAAIYIESAARTHAPSLTGRLVGLVPRIELYTQHPRWASGQWHYGGSVFDSFEPTMRPNQGITAALRRVVVTLGTINGFGFRRLLERLIEIIPPTASILWQVGCTDARGLPIHAVGSVPSSVLDEEIRAADVVVAHAGIGSALSAFEAGHCPILVPRSRSHGEHVDDHQSHIALELAHRKLALTRTPETLTLDDLHVAARRGVRLVESPPPFLLSRPLPSNQQGPDSRRRNRPRPR